MFSLLPWEWWITRALFALSQGQLRPYVLVTLYDDLSQQHCSSVSIIASDAVRAGRTLKLDNSFRVCGTTRSASGCPFMLDQRSVKDFELFPQQSERVIPAFKEAAA